jgi:dTDP-4-dehydrorhamnose reductase
MIKILICGASGMLGSHVQRLLLEKATPFVALNAHQMDITNLDDLSGCIDDGKFTHVINCAAYTQVDKAETEIEESISANAVGPYTLGVIGKRHGVKIIHFSTDYVFNGEAKSPYCEEDPCSPVNAYGMTKWSGEVKLLNEYPKACVIRTSWLFGFPGKNFVSTMLKLMQERDQLGVVADQVGRPTYCQDLAQAAIDLIDAEGVFHFANTGQTSWHQFAVEINRQARELNYPIKAEIITPISTDEYPTPAKRPQYSTLSTDKIERYLGYAPRPWQEALRDYLVHVHDYYSSHQKV